MNCCTLPVSTGNFSPTKRQPFVPCRCKVKSFVPRTSISATGADSSSRYGSRKSFTVPSHGDSGSLAVVVTVFQPSRRA